MTAQHRPLFREAALQQHASPEQLDQLIQVTSAREWLVVLAVLLAAGALLLWSWFGTVTTALHGIVVFPDQARLAHFCQADANALLLVSAAADSLSRAATATVWLAPHQTALPLHGQVTAVGTTPLTQAALQSWLPAAQVQALLTQNTVLPVCLHLSAQRPLPETLPAKMLLPHRPLALAMPRLFQWLDARL